MFAATAEIADKFTEKEIVFRVMESEDSCRIIAEAIVDYAAFSVHFISSDDSNDVSVRIPHFVRFKDAERRDVLHVANEMNAKFRYAKFAVNAEVGAVTIEYDFPEGDDGFADGAAEIFYRLLQIAEEAYPYFMRAIWGKTHEAPDLGKIVFHDFEV